MFCRGLDCLLLVMSVATGLLAQDTSVDASAVPSASALSTQEQALEQLASPPVQFRVNSVVTLDGQARPLSNNVTYFSSTEILDTDKDGKTAAVIVDLKNQKVQLVDFKRRTRCILSADELLRVMAAIQSRSRDGKKPALVREAANPKFKNEWNEREAELSMGGDFLRYLVHTIQPAEKGMSNAYREYADWMARVNAARPGGLPAQARLLVNAQLSQRNVLPASVEFWRADVVPKFRSRHEFSVGLTELDRQQIAKIKQQAESLRSVDFVTHLIAGKAPSETTKR